LAQTKADTMNLDLLGGRENVVQFAGRYDAAPEIDEYCVGDGREI
jgi:hypothetical protein